MIRKSENIGVAVEMRMLQVYPFFCGLVSESRLTSGRLYCFKTNEKVSLTDLLRVARLFKLAQ